MTPKLFGIPVSFVFLTIFLYAAFGAWFVLMLTRNLKKDLAEIRLLSRWQAVGLGTFLNVLFYAFLDFKLPSQQSQAAQITPEGVSGLAVVLNAVILFVVGLATLTPHEKLKGWWRKRAAGEEPYLSGDGLPWPWMALAALAAYSLLVAQSVALRSVIPFEQWKLSAAAIQLLTFLIFTSRDILFLQWCNLTRMKRPLLKGFLYLLLYYTASGIIGGVAGLISPSVRATVLGLTTPFLVFHPKGIGWSASPGIYLGMVLQIAVIFLLLNAISRRLGRPAIISTASAV